MPDGQKVIVVCASCATKYNVAGLQPGTRFRCQKCGNINVVPVPAAPTEPRRPIIGAQVKPQTGIHPLTSKGMSIKTTGLKKGLPIAPADWIGETDVIFLEEEEDISGIEIKKESKTLIYAGIGIGAVILAVVVIALFSGGAGSVGKDKARAGALKETANKPVSDTMKSPAEVKKSSKPKLQDDIDEAVKKEIEPILKDMRNQWDSDPSIAKIAAKGKKAIPILIEAIGGDDEWAARYAYEILVKITKHADTTQIIQTSNKDLRQNSQKNWEDWWFKNKANIPD